MNSKHFIELGHYIGFLGHPEDPGCQEFKDACIVMKEGHVDPDGQVYGKFDLVNTPVGRIVKALIDAGVQFGISVRGAGDVASDGYVDPDTFIFRGFCSCRVFQHMIQLYLHSMQLQHHQILRCNLNTSCMCSY